LRSLPAFYRKDRRLNIRLSSRDLEAIQKRALEQGLPYQTLISSLLLQRRVKAAEGCLISTVDCSFDPRASRSMATWRRFAT